MSEPSLGLERLLSAATEAARLAGAYIMSQFGRVAADSKQGGEVVTEADRHAQHLIIDFLHQRFPDHQFFGEEDVHAHRPVADVQENSVWWVIDPIDGTNNFVNLMPAFCVSIAALTQGRPMAGVILEPNLNTLYTAAAGKGAWRNGAPIQVTDTPLGRDSFIGIETSFRRGTPSYLQRWLKEYRCRNLGTTALHQCYVAEGIFHGSAAKNNKLWDLAAGYLIATEAGAEMCAPNEAPLFPVDMCTQGKQRMPFVCAAPSCAAQLRRDMVSLDAYL